MEINKLCKDAHENALAHGFWEDVKWLPLLKASFTDEKLAINVNAVSTRLMLIVGEVAEAQEGLRENDRDNFREELADVCIRVFDLCGGLDINLEFEITKKMAENKLRPYKHGKVF